MLFAARGEGVSPPKSSWLVQLIVVFAAYSLAGWLGLCVPFEDDRVTLFWLPSGIALAAFYRWSPRLWPAVFAAALLLQTYSGANLVTNLILASGNTLAPLCTLWLLRRACCDLTQLHRANTASFLISSSLGMLISATIGGFTLNTYEQGSFEDGVYTALIWWMGDSLGVFLATPLLVNINRANLDKALRHKVDFFIVCSTSLVVGLCCFPLNNFDNNLHVPIVFTSFVCVAWAALAFGLFGSAVTTVGFAFLAIWSTVNQLGPFTLPSQQLSHWVIWTYAASMTILGLMITAAHTEITTANHQLDKSSQEQEKHKKHLEAVLHAIPDLLFELDRQGQVLSFSGDNNHHLLTAADVLHKNLADVIAPDSNLLWQSALNEADTWGISQGKSICITQQDTTFWYELSIAKLAASTRADDHFICLARDITKRVHSHQIDLASEQRFRSIFEATRNIAVQGYNRFHEVIFWNKASEDLYGFSADEAMDKKLEDLIIPGFMREGVYQAIENWHEKDEATPSGELALQDKHGNEVWVYSNHVLIDTPGHKEMYCLDIDLGPQRKALVQAEQELAERRQIEDALRQSEQRLENAQRMARVAYWS